MFMSKNNRRLDSLRVGGGGGGGGGGRARASERASERQGIGLGEGGGVIDWIEKKLSCFSV